MGLPSLNTQTINSHLTKVATLFIWAVREEWIDKSPASGLSINEAAQSRREPFSVPQLQAMFAAPLFTGCEDDGPGYARVLTSRPRRSRFWVLLLSLYHGLRLNEACQLRPEDIVERDGVPASFVRSANVSQRVKSLAGTRIVPLHPEIISVGFLDFVAEARSKQRERLFPELTLDARGYYSDAFQKWFSRFLVSCSAIGPGKSFHCFRHGWADRLREAGVPEDRRRALGGWANTGVDAGYGRGFPTRMLADDIARVAYPGLEFGFLRASVTA
jgi:integrase